MANRPYILVYKDPLLTYLLVSVPSILTLRYHTWMVWARHLFQRFPHTFSTASLSSGLPWHVPMPSKPCMLRGIALVSLGQVTKTPGCWNTWVVDFNYVYFSSRTLGEMMQFDEYFSDIGWNHQLETCCGVGMGWRNWFNTTILWIKWMAGEVKWNDDRGVSHFWWTI